MCPPVSPAAPPLQMNYYELLERSWSVRNTVPTPNPRRFAIRLIEIPCCRNSTTCSLLKIFLGRWGGIFRPERLLTVLPTFPLAKSCLYRCWPAWVHSRINACFKFLCGAQHMKQEP